ncbi:coniferyl aldehyde dehydrogenase [Variovorax sp. HJSM1_2]|uniref:coniferyl aldehyde dehydrogenase n=1 Tax=Variovorax sp. HJSM1_2 TaxID=3366263 RepID=UPI003BDC3AFA
MSQIVSQTVSASLVEAATEAGVHADSPTPAPSVLAALFEAQYQASRIQVDVPLKLRRDRLSRLSTLLDKHADALCAAVHADFGVRSPSLTQVADLFVLRNELRHAQRQLKRWMAPVRVSTPFYLWPSSAHVQRQALGVVGVISPWNYPLQLAFGPAMSAIAAGNRVMLKPSEFVPRTSELMAELVGKAFAPEEFSVVLGGADVAAEFSSLPFDHLFFTGSTRVGRVVAQAAATNLTPTTLELGGKSPCIVDASCDVAAVALKIAHGKLLNAGQTCIAPDYLLLPRGQEEAFAKAFMQAVVRLFPRIAGNPDYAAIVNPQQHQRLQDLLADAEAQGARVERIYPDTGPAFTSGEAGMPVDRQMPPTLVFDVTDHMRLLREEIFGPILPIIAYDSLDEAITHINARPRPLALYWFGSNRRHRDQVLAQTVSGGVTVNDTLVHFAHENLPFGGVGESGWGSGHGEAGFLRFSQQKPVLLQSRFGGGSLFYPPYGARLARAMKWLRKLG